MECLITLSYPAQPPKPTVTNRMPPADKEEYHTYGAHLEQEIYSYVDRDLIYLVLRLQAHLPADRLSLHELEQYVTDMAAAKENCGQTDAELTQWLQKIMYDPPPPEGEPFEMMPVMRKVARAQRARGSARSQRGGESFWLSLNTHPHTFLALLSIQPCPSPIKPGEREYLLTAR